MKFRQTRATTLPHTRMRAFWVCLLAAGAAVALAPVAGEGLFQNSSPQVQPAMPQMPDSTQGNQINGEQARKQSLEAANAARKKQIAEDSAKLLKLATDLKTEVDKTNKDTLSLNVIRKADEIERLARTVKEKMKITVGAS